MGRSFPWACASNGNDVSIREAINAMQETCKHRVQRGELKRRIVTPRSLTLSYTATSKMISSSTGAPSGRLATPYTKRQGLFVLSEQVLQQLRSGVGDFRLIADISRSGHRYAEPDDSRHFVERSQMLPRDSEDIE